MMIFMNRVLLLYALSFSVFSQEVVIPNTLKTPDRVVLKVAVEQAGFFPFNYQENGNIKGFSIDILNYIKAYSKYDFEFIILPWPRALHLVGQGELDIILGFFITPERAQTYHIIHPSYGYEVNQLFTLKGTDINFTGKLAELTPYSIGTVREYSYGKAFDQASHLKKYPVLSEEVLLKLLLGGRLDAILGNPFTFTRIAQKSGVNAKIKSISPYVDLTPVHMALTRGRVDADEVKRTFERLIRQLKTSVYYQELLDKYRLNY
jgi:polar amino acid transport system substrate-binding protein